MSVQRRKFRLGRDEILQRIRLIHGDNIDISKISSGEIRTVHEKVHLRCNICESEWFPEIRTVIHARTGCPGCAKNRKMTLSEFLRRVKGNGFDYSLNMNFNYKKKILVRCFTCEHIWESIPYTHLSCKPSCPECRRMKTCEECGHSWNTPGKCPICRPIPIPKTLEEFIRISYRLHKERYDYNQIQEFKEEITVQCLKCKHNIRTTMSEHLSTAFQCRFCDISFKV
jgi:hypothetical protein